MKIVIQAYRPEFLPATLHFLNKWWPKHPEVVVITWPPHKLDVKVPVVYLKCDKNYASNMIEFFDHHYHEKHFIHWHEDYILYYPVDDAIFRAAVALVRRKDVGCVRLGKRWTPQTGSLFEEDERFRALPQGQRYRLSHQVAIWQVSTYRGLLRPGETAWQTETRGSTRARLVEQTFLGVTKPCVDYYNLFGRHRFKQGALQHIRKDLPGFLEGKQQGEYR